MATIIKDNDQLNALEQINEYVRISRNINAALVSKSFDIVSDGKKKDFVTLEECFNDKLIAILQKQKEKYVKEVERLTAKYRIGLDDDDKTVLYCKDSVSTALEDKDSPAEEPKENAEPAFEGSSLFDD